MMNDEQARLAVVIVSYNVRELLRRCLGSIDASSRATGLSCTVVVVDNDSHDGSVDMLRSEFPGVDVVASADNLGFAGGNNVALRMIFGGPHPNPAHPALKRRAEATKPAEAGYRPSLLQEALFPQPWVEIPGLGPGVRAGELETRNSKLETVFDYVLLLNPDTEVVGDALARMVRYLERHPEVAVVGPQLRYGDGTLQSSRRRFPTPGTLFWESTLLEQWWPRNRWVRRYRYDDRPVEHATPVGWLVGAALLVRSAAIGQAGVLDEQFWMYSEELEWQCRLARSGGIVYLPEAVIVHHEGKSSEQNVARRHTAFNRSKLRYARLRWGRHVEQPLRLFLLLGYLVQICIEAAKWLLGHKRRLRGRRITQHARVLGALARG